MHIPKGSTAELSLVTFEEALQAANTPTEDYDIKNGCMPLISIRNTGTYWAQGGRIP